MYKTEPSQDDRPHCKNCRFWAKSSDLYGKCLKIGISDHLRFAYEPGQVLAMTPRFGICDFYEERKKEKGKMKKEKRTTGLRVK